MWRILGSSTARAAALLPLLQLTVLAVAGLRLADGALSVGGMLAAWRYGVLATGTGVLVGQLNGLVRGRTAAGRLAEILEAPAMTYGSRQLPPGKGELQLKGVDRRGLRGIDLVVPGARSPPSSGARAAASPRWPPLPDGWRTPTRAPSSSTASR